MQLQYIGARYVPVWYENTDDQTANWQPNVEYEPLTFVTTTNNHLYLSKKTVPDNIGNPADHTEYWLDLGVFITGQYELLQEQIDDIKEALGDIEDLATTDTTSIVNAINSVYSEHMTLLDTVNHMVKQTTPSRIVCITDSYGTHSTTNWCTVLADLFGLSGDNFYYWAEGSSGFEHTGLSGHTFLTLLQAHISNIDSPETISDVFIGGGTNDFYYLDNVNTLIAAMSATATYIGNTFPNAKIHYVFMGYETVMTSALRNKYILAMGAYQSMSYRKGVNVINAYEPMHVGALREDRQHPTSAGGTEIARDIYCKYFGSDYIMEHQGDELSISAASGITIGNNKIWFDIVGNEAVVRLNNLMIFGSIAVNNNTIVEIGTINNRLGQSICNSKTAVRMATVMKFKDSNNNTGTCPVAFFMQADDNDNTLHLCMIISDYGSRTISELKISACDFTIPLMYC